MVRPEVAEGCAPVGQRSHPSGGSIGVGLTPAPDGPWPHAVLASLYSVGVWIRQSKELHMKRLQGRLLVMGIHRQ